MPASGSKGNLFIGNSAQGSTNVNYETSEGSNFGEILATNVLGSNFTITTPWASENYACHYRIDSAYSLYMKTITTEVIKTTIDETLNKREILSITQDKKTDIVDTWVEGIKARGKRFYGDWKV